VLLVVLHRIGDVQCTLLCTVCAPGGHAEHGPISIGEIRQEPPQPIRSGGQGGGGDKGALTNQIDDGILLTKSFTLSFVVSFELHQGMEKPGASGSQLRVVIEQCGEAPGGTSHVRP
jgi:hypothetical protein